MTKAFKTLLYSDREYEIDEYARLIGDAYIDVELLICRTVADAAANISEADIVFGVHLPSHVYASAHKLRWIQSMWAGVERLVGCPVPEHVIITKPHGVFGKYISQYVFGNLLAWRIKLKESMKLQAECTWNPYNIELLSGQRLGIAGLGDIGGEIARIGKAFGMEIFGLNSDGRSSKLADRTFATAEVAQFVGAVDVLVLVMPATGNSIGLFDRVVLSALQPHALLINVGRGALINDAALIELLEQRRIGGAILDVFNEEPLPSNHPYWHLPNCVVTPHIAGPSLPEDITRCFVKNFTRFQAGEPMLGQIDRKRGY